MRIAHLILAHKYPEQLQLLIEALNHPAFDIYIHIDKKVDISPFLYLGKLGNVYFIEKRVKVYWASYGVINATVNGINQILRENYDYINVMSGQDFPLKSADYIYNFLKKKKGTEFITCDSIYDTWKEAAPRVKKYFLTNFRIRFKWPLERILNILPDRKFPLDLDIVGRSCWFTITPKAAGFMIDYLNQHPEMGKFFKYSWGADELIFSTILYNSHFKNNIEDNLMFVDFTGKSDGHPNVLTMAYYDTLKASDKLFARKFDIGLDKDILLKLESRKKTESFN